MALIPRNELIVLRPAAEVLTVSATAAIEINKQAIAAAINNAANTGLTSVQFQEVILPENLAELKAKGYNVQDAGLADVPKMKLITWDSYATED